MQACDSIQGTLMPRSCIAIGQHYHTWHGHFHHPHHHSILHLFFFSFAVNQRSLRNLYLVLSMLLSRIFQAKEVTWAWVHNFLHPQVLCISKVTWIVDRIDSHFHPKRIHILRKKALACGYQEFLSLHQRSHHQYHNTQCPQPLSTSGNVSLSYGQ